MVSNVFTQCLGDSFQSLSPLVQQLHTGHSCFHGKVDVQRGKGLAFLIAWLLGMPRSGKQQALRVTTDHGDEKVIWRRQFESCELNSQMRCEQGFLDERLGLTRLTMQLRCINAELHYTLLNVKLLGVRLPKWLTPSVTAYEGEVDQGLKFTVQVILPMFGKLIDYSGILEPCESGH